MEPLRKDCSEPSVLNMNESEFGINGNSCVIIERDESYLANQISFLKGDFNRSINNQSEIIQEALNENSGFLNKTNMSVLKGKFYAENGFDQIDEENENSSSIFQYSNNDSKLRFRSSKKTQQKMQAGDAEEQAAISKFFNSVDEINDIQYEPSQVIPRKDSENCDLYQINERLSFQNKELNKHNENSFELELRKSVIEKSKHSEIGEILTNDNCINVLLEAERKRSSVGSQKNMQNSIRVSATLNDKEKLKQLQSKLSNISRIESSIIGLDNDPRFTFQINKEILFQNAKETFDNVANGTYISNRQAESVRGSSYHKNRSTLRNMNLIKLNDYSTVIKLKQINNFNNKKCECMHRKPPIEEFFFMLVNAMKLIHPNKEIIIDCKAKNIYEEAMKRKEIQFYEFMSFIKNYLDNYCIKSKLKAKKKITKIKRKNTEDEEPEIIKLVHPDQYDVIEGFFSSRRGRTSIGF